MRVILVGNGTSVLDHNYGRVIDSFDFVVRFNDFVIEGFEKHVGTKTNCWITHDAYHIKTIKNFDRIIVHTWDERQSSLVAELSEHKEIELIKKYEVLKIPSEYPSTGLIGIYKFIKEFGYVTIFGFDWWDRKQHHYFPNITVDRDYIEKKDHDRGTEHKPLEEYRIIKQLEKQGKLSFLKT